MAKKSAREKTTPATPRRTARRNANADAASSAQLSGTTALEPRTTADERTSPPAAAATQDEIAVAAYMRYLERGGTDGRDFDDWIEAERELARRTLADLRR